MSNNKNAWKEKLSGFLSPKSILHKVGEQEQAFYPLSPKILFKLRGLASPLAASIAAIFESDKNDCDQAHRRFNIGTPEYGEETVSSAIAPDLANLRATRREGSFARLVDALTDEKNKHIIGVIITDSMRDVFPRDIKPDEIAQFMDDDGLGLDTLTQMLVGVVKANAKVFGPLEGRLSAAIQTATERMLKEKQESVEARGAEKETDAPQASES